MTEETDLILNAIKSMQEDVRDIRKTQEEEKNWTREKISDLCTRTALTDKEVQTVVQDKVKGETKMFKFISIIGTIISGSIGALTSLKSAGFLH